MRKPIHPCFWFNGGASEAARLYTSLFPDSAVRTEGDMVVILELDGQPVTLLNAGPQFRPNPSLSLSCMFEDEAALDRAWAALSEGGKALMALEAYPWSARYGWLEDRFGISWQLMLGSPKDTAGQRITPSLLFCEGVYGKAEEALQFYTDLFPGSAIEGMLHNPDGTVQHAQGTLWGTTVMVMDSAEPHGFTFSEGASLMVSCDTQEEIDRYWAALAEGGQESRCGWVRDRFGLWWQVVPAILGKLMSDPDRAGRVAQRFMRMNKFEIAPLLEA